MPREYTKGWSVAEREIQRASVERRALLTRVARASGVQGAAGLRYFVKLLRHHLGDIELPECPSALNARDADFIEARAKELASLYTREAA